MAKCDPRRTILKRSPRRNVALVTILALASLGACSAQNTSPPQIPAISGANTRSTAGRLRPHEVNPAYSVVFSFPSSGNSQNPQGPLATSPSGALFGTTTAGHGSIYEYSGGTLQTLHTFTAAFPITGVVRGSDGTLYGTSRSGGSYCYAGCGTIFSLTNTTGTTWHLKTLHAFGTACCGGDGIAPLGPPILIGGALYGTTSEGGGGSDCSLGPVYTGCGTIYRINTDGSGYTIIYRFSDTGPDNPTGPLITDGSGELYGTTEYTNFTCCGSVYKVSTLGLTFTDLHDFGGSSSSDAAYPASGVSLDGSALYGTTIAGGVKACYYYYSGCGTIFKIALSSGFPETVLHQFNDAFGSQPYPSGLTLAPNGTFYGTQQYGGTCCGKVFNITTGGTFTTVHNFLTGSSDGGGPRDTYSQSLSVDSSGTLWGATYNGGGCCGVIYSI